MGKPLSQFLLSFCPDSLTLPGLSKGTRVKRRDGFQGVRLALAIWWKAHRYFLLQNYF